MGILSWFGTNLGGVLGKKWVMAVIATLFLIGSTYIGYKINQVNRLIDEKIELKAQLSKDRAEFLAEIDRITVKNNTIIESTIAEEEILILKAELARQKVKARVELIINKQLNKKLEQLEKIKFENCELSDELKKLLNGEQ